MRNLREYQQAAGPTPSHAESDAADSLVANIYYVPYHGDHVSLGLLYVNRIAFGHPEWNVYGGGIGSSEPPYLGGDLQGNTRSRTRCGSFVNLLLGQAHPFLDDDGDPANGIAVIDALTGSISPGAAKWHDAIAGITPPTPTKYALEQILRVDEIRRGDLLAAAYENTAGDSGHVAIVVSIRPSGTSDPSGPEIRNTRQYIVNVLDSSKDPHGNDTREVTDTEGIGRGDIRLYEDLTTGQIAAWCWSTASSEAFDQATRHMVAGRLLGLPRRIRIR